VRNPGDGVASMGTGQEIIVPPGKKKERLDVFLVHHVENATRNKVQRAIREGHVLVDGKPARPSHQVSPGETILIILPKPPPPAVTPEDIPLEILFEDEALLVVNKPAGMVTHPAYANYSGTLVNALLHHAQSLSSLNTADRPGIVHRLDKDTSGLLVVAKTDHVHALLAKQFADRTVEREYRSVVWGIFRNKEGVIEAELGRSKADRKKIAVVAGGKSAITRYTVKEQFDWLAHLSLKLHTGRTHQIRVHLAHIGHPVFGDPTYGGRRIAAGPRTAGQKKKIQELLELLPGQALHAKTLGFVHPMTRKSVFFDSPLPAPFRALIAGVQAYTP
jgi:23S rRNA pseudouridine1911/1915/1917 synthase